MFRVYRCPRVFKLRERIMMHNVNVCLLKIYLSIYLPTNLSIYPSIYIYREREREIKKMRGWTTSDVKKTKNLIKTFRSETFSSYLLKSLNETFLINFLYFLRQKLSILAFFLKLSTFVFAVRFGRDCQRRGAPLLA